MIGQQAPSTEPQIHSGQQQGFPLWKYSLPGCVERGLVLDLRVCPPQAAASGNLGFARLGLRSKNIGFSHGLAHNRSNVSGSWAEIDGAHINFSTPSMAKKHGSG